LRRADRACLRVQYAGNAATHVRARAQDSTARLPPPLPFDRGQKPQERSLMRVSFVLFDGFTALDAIGAYEVLSRIPGLEVEFAAIDRGIVAADTRRLGLLAYRTLNEIRSTDVLIVPGGPGVRALESDADFLAELRRLDASSQWTVGICNGVTLLAAAGLFEGKKVTTNWFDREYIERYGVEFVPERYYREDKYVTGAGVSASIDTAFFLARMIAGDSVARAIQLGIEYYP